MPWDRICVLLEINIPLLGIAGHVTLPEELTCISCLVFRFRHLAQSAHCFISVRFHNHTEFRPNSGCALLCHVSWAILLLFSNFNYFSVLFSFICHDHVGREPQPQQQPKCENYLTELWCGDQVYITRLMGWVETGVPCQLQWKRPATPPVTAEN